jgi:hypothetical protein
MTTRQAKARERAQAQARRQARRLEGEGYRATMTCPACGYQLQHNNTLAGSWWLQCPTPTSVYLTPGPGCGWQFLWEKD